MTGSLNTFYVIGHINSLGGSKISRSYWGETGDAVVASLKFYWAPMCL